MKKLLFLLVLTLLLSTCSSSGGGSGFDVCINQIAYYPSNSCNGDRITRGIFEDSQIREIEEALSEKEIGECVKVNISLGSNNPIDIYILNDAAKSWLVEYCF